MLRLRHALALAALIGFLLLLSFTFSQAGEAAHSAREPAPRGRHGRRRRRRGAQPVFRVMTSCSSRRGGRRGPSSASPRAHSAFGVAAFTDIWLYSSPTFHLTHRTHLDLFGGLYYPIPSEGAHQDSWAFSVYQEWGCGTKFSSVKVRNRVRNATTTAGGRYDYNSNAEACDALEWIAASRPSIAQWLCAELRANLTAVSGSGGGERECARALKQRSALAACPTSTRYPVLKRPLSVRARETADQRRGRIKAAAISGVAQCRANVPTVCTACAS